MFDSLLNPNLAYLILVAGFWLTIMALLTPGTGIFEIGALFALVLAGLAVYSLPINYWALGVLLLGVLPFALALRRSGRYVYLVISIAALVVGSSFLFRGEGWLPAVNPVLALVVSTLTAVFFWILADKILEAEGTAPTHDLGALIGKVGEARTDIQDEGSVYVAGEMWSATSDTLIPQGTHVRVVGREGFVLQVEPAPKTSPISE
ncbi:MAG: NfeD family protein [Anaerolineales bacterium]|jgi:membrane-bound serine protease (ClpP class)